MMINLPEKVKIILDTISEAGFEAYVVGGCVRDSILGRKPEDWDITTSAKPEEVKKLFDRTIDTGIQHGTVTVMLDKEGFEVTTYRVDGKYEDGRHPSEVTFTPNLKEDLLRRDFTINAMAYNEKEGLVDIFDGMTDIKRGIIRCVGNAEERFNEDALRIMRAVRFSAQLGYSIEEKTREAIKKLAENLKMVSAERIQVELVKLLVSPHPEEIRTAYELGITKVILPEFDAEMECEQNHPHHMYSVGEHTIHTLSNVPAEKYYRLGMLLHDIGKPPCLEIDSRGITHFQGHPEEGEKMAKVILKRLKFDNDTIYYVSKIVRFHDYGNGVIPNSIIVRRAINKIGEDIFPYLFQVKYADVMAQSMYQRELKIEIIREWKESYEQILSARECFSLKDLAVNGNDLINFGVNPGKEVGYILNMMLDIVLDDPTKNTKEHLLSILSEKNS